MHDERLQNTHDFDVVGDYEIAPTQNSEVALEEAKKAFAEAEKKIIEGYLSDKVALRNKEEMDVLEREGLSKLNFKEDGAYTEISPDNSKDVDALSYQVGGDHYKDYKIQPIVFIQTNGLSFCEGNVVKYICRHKNKGQLEDLKKVIHYAKLEAELTYGVIL